MQREPLSRFLVPVDLSKVSRPLVEYAANLASRYGSDIVIAHVIEEAVLEHVAAGYNVTALREHLEEAARKKMNELARIAIDRGVHVEVYNNIEVGDPAPIISMIAEEVGASEILVASKGWGIKRLIPLGSTAALLAKISRIPVIRLKATRQHDKITIIAKDDPFKEIVVAVNDETTREMIDYVIRLAAKTKPRVYITNASLEDTEKTRAIIDEIADKLSQIEGVNVNRIHIEGDLSRKITVLAEQVDAGIVIIKRRAEERLSEVILGTIVDSLIRRLTRPILVYP